jgi:glycosyltransferase involved in cell wall biosynthesis
VHVFFITQWFPTPGRPNYGIFILEHARAVAKKHTVSLLHIHGIDETLDHAIRITRLTESPGIDVYQLDYRRPKMPYSSWYRQLKGAFRAFQLASKQHGRPDIIHANIGNTANVAVILGKRVGIPVVLSEHSSAYARNRFSPAQVRRMRFFMNRVDLIMPVCEALGRKMREYGISRPMISISNVADPAIFYPAAPGEQVTEPCREVALIARLSEEKAVHLAIQAVARLQQRGIYFQLNIAGDGPERFGLEAMVAEAGLGSWVHFHGNLAKESLASLLRRASIFLLTSLWENQPVVILEAITCGLPVVAPAVGGIPEVITSTNGRLFSPGNLDDLCEQLVFVLNDFSAYDTQSIHKCAVSHFSPEVVGDKLDAIYQSLIEDRHAFEHSPDL